MEPRPSPAPGENGQPRAHIGPRALGGVIKSMLIRRKTLAVLAVLAVFGFSSIPFEHPLRFHRFDKEFHVIEYMVVGLMLFNLITKGFRQVSAIGLVLGFVFLAFIGVIDEFYQYWIPGRSPDRSDFFYSALGAALALAITAIIGFWISRAGRKQGLTNS